MDEVSDEIILKILRNIPINKRIKYIPYGDGEQNYTYIYEDLMPYCSVNKLWKNYFFKEKDKSNFFSEFFKR